MTISGGQNINFNAYRPNDVTVEVDTKMLNCACYKQNKMLKEKLTSSNGKSFVCGNI